MKVEYILIMLCFSLFVYFTRHFVPVVQLAYSLIDVEVFIRTAIQKKYPSHKSAHAYRYVTQDTHF